jgi:hypothetical protein
MKSLILLLAASTPAFAQNQTASEIKIFTDPSPASVRPFETVVVQVRVYGEVAKQDGQGTDKARIQKGGAAVKPVGTDGGWVSKPFKFQGRDDEAFYQGGSGRFASVLGMITKDYVLQDAFLYTAPEKPGKYEMEASLDGKTARVTVEVDAGATARKKPETTQFPPETRKPDPYRKVAEYWAPMIAQETWWQPKSDIPARFDFDGDWKGDNNWDNMETGSSQAYIHYAAMETSTHWFLIYNVWHPRDYSDKCVVGTCHENDNEGMVFTVRKDGSEFGKLEVIETLAHNNLYSFTNDTRIRNGIHDIDGAIEFYNGSHPVIFVESGGHGEYCSTAKQSSYRLSSDTFTNNTGITFIYKGTAERARHSNDRLVGYELLPIYDHWWTKATEDSGWKESTWDEYFLYTPFGGRPAGPRRKIGGTFLGRNQASNKAKPFWGWHDNTTLKKKVLNVGQWGLDPAYAVQKDLTFPRGEEPSVDYTFNPYLGIEAPVQ